MEARSNFQILFEDILITPGEDESINMLLYEGGGVLLETHFLEQSHDLDNTKGNVH